MFYPGGGGHHEARGLSHNGVSGLPGEDLDEYIRKAIDLAESGGIPY